MLILVSGCVNKITEGKDLVTKDLPAKDCGADIDCLNESLITCKETTFERAEFALLANFTINLAIFGEENGFCKIHYAVAGIPSEKVYEERTCFVPKDWDYSYSELASACKKYLNNA